MIDRKRFIDGRTTRLGPGRREGLTESGTGATPLPTADDPQSPSGTGLFYSMEKHEGTAIQAPCLHVAKSRAATFRLTETSTKHPDRSVWDEAVSPQVAPWPLPGAVVSFRAAGFDPDPWAYVHRDGAIGPDGPLSGVDVDLPSALGPFELPPPPDADGLHGAIGASLRIFEVAPDRVAVPLLCASYRAALGGSDFSLHLAGPTGAGKSELAALVQQHFGPRFDARNLPGSWSSTGNALESLAFVAKDAILTVDDFAPCGTTHDIARFHREADRILRAQGNRSGRHRLRPDGTLRPVKPPRGLILSTGEDVPRGQSLGARLAVVEVGPADVNWDVLTQCQRDAAAGQLAVAMSGYVQWLAGRHGELDVGLPDEIAELRREATCSGQHRRTPTIVASLALGWRYFLAFAQEVGAVTADEAGTLWDRAWAALGGMAGAQGGLLATSDPARRFCELLASAIASGQAHVAGPAGDPPEDHGPKAFGWHLRTVGTGQHTRQEWHPQGPLVGWAAADDLYLDPDAAFKAAQAMAGGTGEGISVGATTLHKRLRQGGHLASVDAQRGKLTVRRTLGGARRRVLHLRVSSVLAPEGAQSAQWIHDPAPRPGNADVAPESWADSSEGAKKPAHGIGPQDTESAHKEPASHPQETASGPNGPIGPLSQTTYPQDVSNGPADGQSCEREVVRL